MFVLQLSNVSMFEINLITQKVSW